MKIILSGRRMKVQFFTTCYIIAILVAGCDLPRENPLDPKACNYGLLTPEEPALPILQVVSFHCLQYYPQQEQYFLEAMVYDEGAENADSVKFVYADTVYYEMFLSGSKWRLSLESASYLSVNIFDLIGVPYDAILYYSGGDSVITDEACLLRIIEEIPEPIYPKDNVAISNNFEMSWEELSIKFDFTYTITVCFIAPSSYVTEIDRIEGLSDTLTAYTYSEDLMEGSYYWTLGIVDVYGNISRSKEAAFKIEQ